MDKNTIIMAVVGVVAIVIGFIIGMSFKPTTADANYPSLDVCQSQLDACNSAAQHKEPIVSMQEPSYTNVTIVSFDYMGATGDEPSGYGNGWIEASKCLEQINKDTPGVYKTCMIQNIQILTGSDPNPLKIHMGGQTIGGQVAKNIFGNAEVFNARCVCSSSDAVSPLPGL